MGDVQDKKWPININNKPKENPPVSTLLKKGSKGQDVKELQLTLNNKFGFALVADGVFGPRTEAAVIKFQADHGLVEDGIVGPRTRAALEGNIKDAEPPRMTNIPDLDPEELIFVKVKGVSYKEYSYRTKSKMAEGLVVHYTVSGRTAKSAIGVVKYLASKGLGCMVMDEDGIIYVPENFDPMKDAAAHAGVSKWNGHSGLNDEFAGIEICNWGRSSMEEKGKGRTRFSKKNANIYEGWYQPYTAAQEAALIKLCHWMAKQNPAFKMENVVGHDECRTEAGQPGGKTDPGASLSMTMPQLRKLLIG